MESKKKRDIGTIYNKYGIGIILIAIVIIAAFMSPAFLTVSNLTNVLRQVAVITLLGFGSTFILITGEINVAYDTVIALIGCASVMVVVSTGSVFLAVITALILGGFLGAFYGFFVTRFNVPAFIVGLALSSIAEGAVLVLTNATAITGLSNEFKFFGQGYVGFIPFPVLLVIVFLLTTWYVLSQTKFGRHVYAVGGNRKAAEASGISSKKTVMLVFVIDGIITGVASIVFMGRLGSGQPTAGTGYCFDAITAVVVGGTSLSGGYGGVTGTIIGACVIGVINNIMNLVNVNSYWQSIVKGIIILAAVVIDVVTKKKSNY